MNYATTPAFIIRALSECIAAGVVPSICEGTGGNSHSTWFIKFAVRVDREGGMSQYHDFEVKATSSYGQKFLSFTPFSGPGFDGLTELRSMADCVARAREYVAAIPA